MTRFLMHKAKQAPPIIGMVLGLLGLASLVYAGSDIWALSGLTKWHVAYFPDIDFGGGAVRERWTASPDFDFGETSPMAGIPKDGFSVRAETCLSLRIPRQVHFALSSDDGSRMFLDGELIVEDWGNHGMRYRHADTVLAPGCHSLRIEYFEGGGSAALQFLADLDGGTLGPIDPGWLSRPSIERGQVRCKQASGGGCE